MSSIFPALILLCWFILLAGAALATAVDMVYMDCPNNTNNSAFQANLEAFLSSVPPATVASGGFVENITGAAPNQVFGLAQCRADVNATACRKCLDGSVRDVATMCPAGNKVAALIYDKCELRYSDANFFGDNNRVVVTSIPNPDNATDPAQFTSTLAALMGNITEKAAYASPRMFAVRSAVLTPFEKLYGMAQCTRDVVPDDCNRCLATAVAYIPNCCNDKEGGRIISKSCTIRFEVYPFYNVQDAEAAMALPPPPGGGPVNGTGHVVPGSTGSKRTFSTVLLVSIIALPFSLFVLLLVALYLCKRKRKLHKHEQIAIVRRGDTEEDDEMRSLEPVLYDLSTLRAATDNFSEENKLGEGGFGPVYKGILQNGQEIAVKRLSTTSQQGQVEMKNEVLLVAKLQHKNLVRILGCCIQEHERMLIYEFLSNNSLDKIIFDPARQHELNWGQRHKIIEGIARGLLYLHEDSRLTIIHRDLKASNILLDKDMNPKISDFGLAKMFNVDSSVGNTSRIAGTYGYMSPEYALHGIYSAKSDVFSYGVLVLEVVTGRRNTQVQGSEYLLTFVWRCWRRGSIDELLDGCPADGRQPQEVMRFVHVGLLCVQDDPQLRPGMASVVIMLNSRSITLPAPTAPAFVDVSGRPVAAINAHKSSTDGDAARADHCPSINDSFTSDLELR